MRLHCAKEEGQQAGRGGGEGTDEARGRSYRRRADCRMTKKKSNGFMFFADSRRTAYESEAGTALGARRLVERAAADWARMRPEEQARWKTESRRKQETQLSPTLARGAEAGVVQPKVKNRGLSQLEKELLGRCRERGVARSEARQTLAHKLIWRETETLDQIRQRKWCIVVASEEMILAAPAEIWAFAFEGETVTGELGIVVRTEHSHQYNTASQNAKYHVVQWNPDVRGDINTACLALSKFSQNCWGNIILVAATQFDQVAQFLHWMKDSRDSYYKRDTTSIRLDRLICVEDVIQVFREFKNYQVKQKEALSAGESVSKNIFAGRFAEHEQSSISAKDDLDDDLHWENLCDEPPQNTRMFGSAACDYVRHCLSETTKEKSVFETPREHIEEGGIRVGGHVNPFANGPPTGKDGGHKNDTKEDELDTTQMVRDWLEFRCPIDAEYEPMDPMGNNQQQWNKSPVQEYTYNDVSNGFSRVNLNGYTETQ